MKIWLNGKVVDERNAKVSVFDRGFLYGDGVFETMRSYNGVVFKLDEHLYRLNRSLKITEIKIPYPAAFLKKQVYGLLKVHKINDAYIRITVTRGVGTIGLAKITCKRPTIMIVVNKFVPYPETMYKKGVSLKTVSAAQNENSPASMIKSTSFLNYILARLEAKKGGFDDAIMLNSKKRICESTVSNIFMVKGRDLITPPAEEGVLPGITREVILSLAARLGLKAREKALNLKRLYSADEVFLTNSLMEVMSVSEVDGRFIGSGKPGEFTHKIHLKYKKIVQVEQGSSKSGG